MNTNAQIFILCEDTIHYHFAKKYFELLGFNKRRITGKYNPKGRSVGSGAEFVKENYVKELKSFKSKANHLNAILVVIIDDDTKNHLSNIHKIYMPLAHEKILLFSPKRNIESWFHYISGNNINESTNYKQNYRKSKPTEFSKKLKQICLNGLSKNAPLALSHACKEINKLRNA